MNRKLPIILGFAVLLGAISSPDVSAELEYHSEIGSSGIDNGDLDGPTDVVISSNGRTMYVVDSENNRINVFEDDGDHDFKFGSFCSIFSIHNCNDNAIGADNDGDRQFDNPKSATLDLSGNFFVVDSDDERVQRFDDDGRFEIKFGSVDSTATDYLGSPQGIAVLDSTREIYVSDRVTDLIHVFDSSGNFIFDFDSFDGNDDFRNPSYLLIDNGDKILYVSDSSNNQIIIFELVDGNNCPAGTDEVVDGVCFVEKFGTTGSDDGEFNSPAGLALDSTNDLLYVADTNNDRIQILSLSTSSLTLAPSSPENIHASPISATSVIITWDEPIENENISEITGYKIEYKIGSENYESIIDDTQSTATSFIHKGLETDTCYSYRVYAINSDGVSDASSIYTIKPQQTTTPSGLIADAISPNQVKIDMVIHLPILLVNQ